MKTARLRRRVRLGLAEGLLGPQPPAPRPHQTRRV